MIYFHSIWEHQKQSLPAGVARFKNTYTCLYIHISVFLFRLIVAGRAALVKCFYFEPFKFTAPERCDICRYIKSSFLSPPGCTALFASIAVAIVIAHLAVVVFQLTKLYFYMGPTSPNQLTKTNSALAESLRFCFWPNEMFWPAANWQLTPHFNQLISFHLLAHMSQLHIFIKKHNFLSHSQRLSKSWLLKLNSFAFY